MNTDYSQRYHELHVHHLALLENRYRDQRLDSTRQALAADQQQRIERSRQLDRDLGQNIDIKA